MTNLLLVQGPALILLGIALTFLFLSVREFILAVRRRSDNRETRNES